MTRQPRKTDRPRRYPAELRSEWVARAVETSAHEAARKFGVSVSTVRKDLLAAGHSPKRTGAPCQYTETFAKMVAEHRKTSPSTKATARTFDVSEDTVCRFVQRHG